MKYLLDLILIPFVFIMCKLFELFAFIVNTIIYFIWQVIHIIWYLKPHKHLLKKILNKYYYYYTHRISTNDGWCSHMRRIEWTSPKSLFEYLIWTIKYGYCGEITELTKKEEEYYESFKSKLGVNENT